MNKPTTLREYYEKEEWGGWKIVSDMLDDPNEYGIYNTSKCYQELYNFVVEQKKKAVSSHHTELVSKIEGIVREETPSHFTREYRDTDFMRDRICKRCRELLQSSLCLTKTKKTDENNGEGGLEITEKIE